MLRQLRCGRCPPALQAKASLRNTLLGSVNGDMSSGGSNSSNGGSSVSGGRQDRQKRPAYPPIARPDPEVVKARCGATQGDWCGRYAAQEPIPAEPLPAANKSCLWGCNFVGECGAPAQLPCIAVVANL